MGATLALLIGDPPELWEDLGFTVDGGVATIGEVDHVLGGEQKGIRAWSLCDPDGNGIDGIPTRPVLAARSGARGPDPATRTAVAHPNGVVELDHVVLFSPDLDRTVASLEGAGFEVRRRRDIGTAEHPRQQVFFRIGPTILELIGAPGERGEGVPRFFGLAFTVADLDSTAAFLGERLHASKPAVQPGRRIATLDRGAGSTVAMAFMSPHPHGEEHE
jgi:catechol 2,3-dioxygenase-like lactoylglutathione lyase family enzyme